MDLLYWTQLNPNIVYEPTRKQFYGRFCYKLILTVYGARIINGKDTVANEVALRQRLSQTRRNYNYGGSWMRSSQDDFDKIDPVQLETMRSIKNGYGSAIKIRIEEPWVQIYTEDLQTLKDIAGRFTQTQQHSITGVSFPDSNESKQLLEAGKILVKSVNKIGFKYKVFLKDGSYSPDIKRSVFDYLTALGNDVKVSAATQTMLSNGHSFIWGCFLYVNDPAVMTMVSLISPRMVGKIHELVDGDN